MSGFIEKASEANKEFKMKMAEIQKEYHKKAKELMQKGVQELFDENPGLNGFRIIGYTPGFNDGDPCTHSQYLDEEWGFYSDPEEDPEYQECVPNKGTDEELGEMYGKVDSFFDDLRDFLHSSHGTNWQLTFTRNDDGSFDMEEEEHYCGY